MVSIGPLHKSRSRQESGLLAGTNPSKVAARLSLADLLLMLLLGMGTTVSLSTDAITAATVALVRAFIIRHSSTLDALSRTGRQLIDGYFNIFSSKWLCDDVVVVTKVAAIAKGRSAQR